MLQAGVILCILTTATFSGCCGYKPVIFMHGLISGPKESINLFKWIQKDHPGTKTFAIDKFDFASSVVDLVTQTKTVGAKMATYMKQYPGGVNLICFSQGGLVCRGVLEQFKHNVHTFISLSSPQAGQFGDTVYVKRYLPDKYTRDEVYKIAYTPLGQMLSIFNYWNDPKQQRKYEKFSKFLAVFNNDTFNPKSKEFKSNFCRLRRLVLIGGPDDGVIMPWQSSLFGTYDSKLNVVNMTKTKWYKSDQFGLRTLDKRRVIKTHIVPGLTHTHWYRTESVYRNYILPYLT